MSQFVEFLDDYFHERLGDIDIGMVGRIISFNRQTMRADVTPLLKKKSGNDYLEYAPIRNIPVNFLLSGGYYIAPEYSAGDLVHVAFSTHEIAEALQDQKPVASKKIFSAENAFVVGGIAPTGWEPPAAFSGGGLLIGNSNQNTQLKFEGGDITFSIGEEFSITHSTNGTVMNFPQSGKLEMKFGDTVIEFSATGLKVITATGTVDFLTHMHATLGSVPTSS